MARMLPSFWFGLLVSVAMVVMLIIVCAPIALYLWAWRDTTPRGPLPAMADWPDPIRELHSDMVGSGIDATSIEVYLVHGRPGDTVSTVLCRMHESPGALDFLKKKLETGPLPADKLGYLAFVMREAAEFAPPDWWASSEADSEYVASRGILEGSEGDLYIVAHDRKQQRLFIHYYFDF